MHGTFIEVTPGGETVWRYVNPVVRDGPLTQGDAIPLDPSRAGELMNAVFRVYRYGPDYPGLAGRDLTPGLPIERYPGSARKATFLPIILDTSMDTAATLDSSGTAEDRPKGAWQIAIASLSGLIENAQATIITPSLGILGSAK